VKQGFTFKDYRFLDKDKHLDLFLEYQSELYQLRLSVADKVRSGTIETLVQDMRRSGAVKGIVITSTEFTNDVQKSAKGRKNILLIDGETLFGMAEG
jgi:restriction endonuclease Mrr